MSKLFSRKGLDNNTSEKDDIEHWVSSSDLMSGLMMVFLFVSIALMRHAYEQRNQMRNIAVAYENTQYAIYYSLMDEFREDLPKWNAKINRETLSIEFTDISILFEFGSAKLKPEFEEILNDFFPRYMRRLEDYRDSIQEIRIEGHASSYWSSKASEDEAYANNMILSQERTRSVLFHVQTMPELSEQKTWMKKHIAAIGFSSSHIVTDTEGNENADASRRVTFRVLTNADKQLQRMLSESNET